MFSATGRFPALSLHPRLSAQSRSQGLSSYERPLTDSKVEAHGFDLCDTQIRNPIQFDLHNILRVRSFASSEINIPCLMNPTCYQDDLTTV